MPTTYPPGSRFLPTDLGLVKLHLRNKVKRGESGFIKTMNVYGDVPWRLDHDTNPLYPRNEWYYFAPRTIRGTKTVCRIVPSKGESLGGTWRGTVTKKDIKNKANKLKGYKTKLEFKKTVEGKSDKEKTDWLMDEYSLHMKGAEFHGLVLCHIKLVTSKLKEGDRRPAVPAHQVVDNNVLANQEVGFAMPENDANQHQQQYQDDSPTLVNQGQYPSWDMVPVPSHVDNNNNNTFLPNQEIQEAGFANQHQQQEQEEQQDSHILINRPFQSNHNQGQYLLEDVAFPNQYHQQPQQEERQDSLSLPHRPFQRNDNQGQYLLEHIAFGNQHQQQQQEEQQDSLALINRPSQSNHNQGQYQNDMVIGQNDRGDINQHQQQQPQQEHYPPEDNTFNGADDDDETFTLDEFLNIYNQGKEQQDSPTLVPSQMENNNNTTVLPKEEQQEADFANHNDMAMVEKEHGDVKQEQEQEDLTSRLLAPFQSNDNHGQCPPRDTLLVSSQVENHNNNIVIPNQEQREASFAHQNDMSMVENEHGDYKPQQEQEDSPILLRAPLQRNDNQGQILGAEDKCLTQEQLQQLEIIIGKFNMSF